MAHNGRISSMIFIEEGQKLVTAGVDDGLITLWKVTYDTEEADPSVSWWCRCRVLVLANEVDVFNLCT